MSNDIPINLLVIILMSNRNTRGVNLFGGWIPISNIT